MNALRVLDDGDCAPAWNMAADEALLLGGHPATLRFYGWRPHAVSLGYFQPLREFADVAATTPVVRRLTGGGAIHHGDELTFALAIDATLLPTDVAASYRLLHDAIVGVLAAAGVPCRRLDVGDAPHARPRERWCFAEPGRDDIVTARGKLLGSAQRRIATPRPRVLHHGSLVVHRPTWTPFVAAVADAPRAPDHERLRGLLAPAIAGTLRLSQEAGAWSAAELDAAATLEPRYLDPAWTARR